MHSPSPEAWICYDTHFTWSVNGVDYYHYFVPSNYAKIIDNEERITSLENSLDLVKMHIPRTKELHDEFFWTDSKLTK